jgi:hypothetical protein
MLALHYYEKNKFWVGVYPVDAGFIVLSFIRGDICVQESDPEDEQFALILFDKLCRMIDADEEGK